MESVAYLPDPAAVGDPSVLASRLAAIVESSDDAIISKTLDGTILTWNRGAQRIFGYSAEEIVGRKMAVLVPPNRGDEVATILREVAKGNRVDHFQTVRRRKDGREIYVSVTISPILGADGKVVAASKVARDITAQTLAAVERDRFFDLSTDLLSTSTFAGEFQRINPAFGLALGYDPDEILGHPIVSFAHAEDVGIVATSIERLRAGEQAVRFEARFRTRAGTYRWLSWRSAPHTNAMFYSVARDVTEERLAKEAMAQSLREKEVLLQEVHHRVKNNLQVVSSLINMQLRTLEKKTARASLEECQSRIQAIALIHERLYQSKDFGKVAFRDYMTSLATTVFDVAGVSPGRVRLALEIGDVSLPVDRAIPCALILNELILNALKHAFPSGTGTVTVTMARTLERVFLRVEDDGRGLPPGLDIETSTTLGLQLVDTLRHQLEAKLVLGGPPGASFSLEFDSQEEATA